jgi:16S rRNA (guanine527-N7)-methyltransferase
VNDAAVEAELRSGAAAFGLALGDGQFAQLVAYLKLIERWTAVYNLTAVRDRPGIVRQHLLDSLAIVPALRRHAQVMRESGEAREAREAGQKGATPNVLDVGSGAGLPGLVLAIAEPMWRVTCVDTVAKKAGFIRQAIGELGLDLAAVRHARVEQLPAASANLIVSRAFASLQDFTSLSDRALAPWGVWAAMKGRVPAEEIPALPVGVEVFHVEPLQVPGLDVARCLVWMRRRCESAAGSP